MRIVDVSSNNPHPIDWHAVAASDVEGVFIKATEGTGYTNPDYVGDRDGARAAGLHVAAYHFQGTGTPQAEAAYFHSVAGPDAKILDRETSTDDAWTNAFLVALNEPADQEMTYGSESTLHSGDVSRGLLWVAAYGPTPPGYGECWQETDAAVIPGIGGKVDLSVWTGSQGQWATFFGLGTGGTAVGTGNTVTDVVGMRRTPSGKGYYLVGSDGGVFCFGDAVFHGSMGGKPLDKPMVGIAVMPDNTGYWLAAADGGVFCFGNAPFLGSMGGKPLTLPVVGIETSEDGKGYWLVAADSGIFSFGDAPFEGSLGH